MVGVFSAFIADNAIIFTEKPKCIVFVSSTAYNLAAILTSIYDVNNVSILLFSM